MAQDRGLDFEEDIQEKGGESSIPSMGMGKSGGFGGMGGGGFGGMGGGFGGFGGGFGGGMGGGMGGGFGGMGSGSTQPKPRVDDQNLFADEQPKQQKKRNQNGQTKEEQLARLTKKLDIPQSEQVTIVDWAIRGPAEFIRLVLQYILVPYKQRKYTFSTKKKWINQDQPQARKKNPIVDLPYLEDGDKIICGVEAIILHILLKYNRQDLLGNTPQKKVRVATFASLFWDMYKDYQDLSYGRYPQDIKWQKAKDKYIHQKFRVQLNRIAGSLKYKLQILPGEYTWVDFAIAQLVDIFAQLDFRFKDYLLQLQNYSSKVQAVPQFIVYKRSYRFHQRPINGFGSIFK